MSEFALPRSASTARSVRHLWWWLGGRPASASVMRAMLSRGRSALVCPGGVRECLYMEHGREAVYLSNRTGFVRIALQYGAPPLCVFMSTKG